ncbi:MAG: dienelactone hydrolase family protein [Burkholderiaceae bacterium]|jgi:carboxymethylenebutenolidase|nr:dienelactone hydrolase family protein [Burkholderiaceae bacterium]
MLQQELDCLVPRRDFSRRDFVRTSVGSGFAAAVLPVVAQTTLKTDTTGLLAGEVSIPVGNFKMPAYRAAPLNKRNAPVVLVISEIFGVHEHIADVARRFAKQGYFAIAPELFVRQGDAQSYSEISKLIAEVVSKASDAQVIGDLDATVAWAAQQGAAAQRLGITGFCWGGRIVWLYAAHNPALKAGVAWYGRLLGDISPVNPQRAIDLVGSLKAPVLGLYGGQDPGIPLASVAAMQEALANGSPAARRSKFVVFPDAPHAFHADYRPSYRKAAAEEGWALALDWFKTHGVA